MWLLLLLALVGCPQTAPPPPAPPASTLIPVYPVYDVIYQGMPFPPAGTTDIYGAVILNTQAPSTELMAVCQGFVGQIGDIRQAPSSGIYRITYWFDKRPQPTTTQGARTCDELVPNYDPSGAAQALAKLTSYGVSLPTTSYTALLAMYDPRTGVAGYFGIPTGSSPTAVASIVTGFRTQIVQSDLTTRIAGSLSPQQSAQGQVGANGPTNTSGGTTNFWTNLWDVMKPILVTVLNLGVTLLTAWAKARTGLG